MAYDCLPSSINRYLTYRVLLVFFLWPGFVFSQLDSLARNLVDSVKAILIDEEVPKKTFGEKFMYPHRWYVKQLLKPKQPYYDTNYISSNKRKLNLSVAVAKKFYGFNITDIQRNQTIKFAPNNYYYLGFNCSNIILSFGFYPGIRFGAQPGKGNTSGQDFQLTVIGRRVITDINYQRYRGFYSFLAGGDELNKVDADNVMIRPDINVFSFGANTFFVFNYKKYSLRGAFSFTDIQRRSAGSFMAGLYHSYLLFASFDSTLVLDQDRLVFSPALHQLTNISQIVLGLSGGYGYTHVLRKFIFSTAVNSGIAVQRTNYETSGGEGHSLFYNPAVNLNVKAAIRYDNNNFYSGVLGMYVNNYSLNTKMFNTENYMGRILIFAGYRFDVHKQSRKVLRALKLVDY